MKKELIISVLLFSLVLAVLVGASSLMVNVTPTTVSAGHDINISVSPGVKGIWVVSYIYRSPSFYSGWLMFNCTTNTCYNPVNATYHVPASFVNGEYYFTIYDLSDTNYSTWIKQYNFTVAGGAPLRNLSVNITPKPAVAGTNITIQIFPGTEGIWRDIFIYSSKDLKPRGSFYITSTMCPYGKASFCYTPVNLSYYIPANSTDWVNGEYFVRINDISEPGTWFYGSPTYTYGTPKNFTFNVIGGVQGRDLSVTIDPLNVQAGNSINVNLIPPAEGTSKYVYIYKNKYGGIYKNYSFVPCGSNVTWGLCFDQTNFNINIPSNWVSDEYYLSVYDNSVNWWSPDVRKKFYFHVNSEAPFTDLNVAMYPEYVMGRNLTVQITPGSEGIGQYVWFYDINNRYRFYENLYSHGCRNFLCYDPVNISLFLTLWSWQPGQYKMQIVDNNINNKSYFYFNVTNYSCIHNQSQYDACANDNSKVVVDSPSCAPFTKFINEQCTAYGNFSCGWANCTLWEGSNCIGPWEVINNTADSYCWSTPNNKPIGTDKCATDWACPQEQTPYLDNASCIASMGTPVEKLGCLSNVTCKFYQDVSQACRDFKVGDCIKNQAQYDRCGNLNGEIAIDGSCPSFNWLAYNKCIKYNYNFTCSDNESVLCGTRADYNYTPIPTPRCDTGWACPANLEEYDTNQSCLDAGGILQADPLCLVYETKCLRYDPSTFRCTSP